MGEYSRVLHNMICAFYSLKQKSIGYRDRLSKPKHYGKNALAKLKKEYGK